MKRQAFQPGEIRAESSSSADNDIDVSNLQEEINMEKEYKVNGKVTYPQGAASRTTYTLIDDVGNMINLNADTDTDFDYGDAVVMSITKKDATASTTVDPVTGSVTISDTTANAENTATTTDTAPTDTAENTTATDTAKSDATTTADTTDTQAASTETEAD